MGTNRVNESPIITLNELNERYGKYGQTFNSKDDADRHSAKFPGSRVYRLMNHTSSSPGEYKEESRRCIGWLVSKTDKNRNPIPQIMGRR